LNGNQYEKTSNGFLNIGLTLQIFSFSAVITSFIGFEVGFLEFFNDLFLTNKLKNDNSTEVANEINLKSKGYSGTTDLKIETTNEKVGNNNNNNNWSSFLVLVPPTIIASINPNIFVDALDIAGTYGISILFGILPSLLVLKTRFLFIMIFVV
jgi:tyrosine-specific transport protein